MAHEGKNLKLCYRKSKN